MTIQNRHLTEALDVIAGAHESYPDSRNLALNHAELLAVCGKDAQALDACEAFTLRFGIDENIMPLGLKLRGEVGLYNRLAEMGRESISLCMIVKNEEKTLAACLASVRPVADEMIVVDTGSNDRTADIAAVFGAKLYYFPWNDSFADARNYGISRANGKWILVMDADEVLSVKDYPIIRQTVKNNSSKPCAWSVITRNYSDKIQQEGWCANKGEFKEERGLGWIPSKKSRLFPNDSRIRFQGDVHEMVENTLRNAGIPVVDAPFVVHHYGTLDQTTGYEKKLHYFNIGNKKLEQNPDDMTACLELAIQAGELNLHEDALLLWGRLLKHFPLMLDPHFNSSHSLMALGRYEEALQAAKMAHSIDPDHKESAFNLATCELYVGDPKEALRQIERIVEKYPDYPPARALLIVILMALGNTDSVVEHIKNISFSGIDLASYLGQRAERLRSLGRTELAAAILSNSAKFSIKTAS